MLNGRIGGRRLGADRLQMVLFEVSAVFVAPDLPHIRPCVLERLEGVAELPHAGAEISDFQASVLLETYES